MKALPLVLVEGEYCQCDVAQATHVELRMPCVMSHRVLPVITSGPRKGTPCWTWNGDTERPTLRPSILTRWTHSKSGSPTDEICHSFVSDGRVEFLGDCTHDKAGQTLDLLEVAS